MFLCQVFVQQPGYPFQKPDQDKVDQGDRQQRKEGLHGPAADQVAGTGEFHDGDVTRYAGLLDKGDKLRDEQRSVAPLG